MDVSRNGSELRHKTLGCYANNRGRCQETGLGGINISQSPKTACGLHSLGRASTYAPTRTNFNLIGLWSPRRKRQARSWATWFGHEQQRLSTSLQSARFVPCVRLSSKQASLYRANHHARLSRMTSPENEAMISPSKFIKHDSDREQQHSEPTEHCRRHLRESICLDGSPSQS